MSSAFHPVFLVIYVAKERERKIFWHWIFRRPIRRGMIAFSRTWRGQFNLSLISLNRSTFFSFSFASLVVEFKIGRRESGVCYLEEERVECNESRMDVDVDVEKESLLQGQEVLFKGRERGIETSLLTSSTCF